MAPIAESADRTETEFEGNAYTSQVGNTKEGWVTIYVDNDKAIKALEGLVGKKGVRAIRPDKRGTVNGSSIETTTIDPRMTVKVEVGWKGEFVERGKAYIKSLTEPYIADKPGSPTKAEVMAVVDIYKGENIPDEVREAVLMSANDNNREDVMRIIEHWNALPTTSPRLREGKREIGRSLTIGMLASAMSERGYGIIDTSQLIQKNLKAAMLSEVMDLIREDKLE